MGAWRVGKWGMEVVCPKIAEDLRRDVNSIGGGMMILPIKA